MRCEERILRPISDPHPDARSGERSAERSPPGERGERCRCLDAAPDALLARRAAHGDDTACGELIRRYQDRVYMIAYSYVQNRDEALDITQETFVRMLEGLPRYREQASFYTWLHRIVLNRCADWGRRRSRHPPSISLDHLMIEGRAEPADGRAALRPDQALMAKELREQIQVAIATVPELFRRVVLLADIEGLSTREIADRLGCPVNTVKSRLHRGRSMIRKRVGAYLEGGC